jgi:23S rRNA (pseudouridine1915-N3)-methyltransferase
MNIKILWPGKTRTPAFRELEEFYAGRIRALSPFEIVVTAEARGLDERAGEKIKDIEAKGLEKHFKDDYIVCLIDEGREMSSKDLARFFERRAAGPQRSVTFVVGGFLGLAHRILERADLRMSVSRMTFSHELCRIMLMEQIYRSMSIVKGRAYAK